MTLREAWFEIAWRIAYGKGIWICNTAQQLPISPQVHQEILGRVAVEAKRQGIGIFSGESLWNPVKPRSVAGRVVRIRFIAAELRRLAGQA